jgi:hypothetical protein
MRLCEALVDARTLRLELLEELRQMVPFDAYAWLLTDPETSGRLITAGRRALSAGAAPPDSAEVPHRGEPLDATPDPG